MASRLTDGLQYMLPTSDGLVKLTAQLDHDRERWLLLDQYDRPVFRVDQDGRLRALDSNRHTAEYSITDLHEFAVRF